MYLLWVVTSALKSPLPASDRVHWLSTHDILLWLCCITRSQAASTAPITLISKSSLFLFWWLFLCSQCLTECCTNAKLANQLRASCVSRILPIWLGVVFDWWSYFLIFAGAETMPGIFKRWECLSASPRRRYIGGGTIRGKGHLEMPTLASTCLYFNQWLLCVNQQRNEILLSGRRLSMMQFSQ